ncbi:MAG: DNA/pantothenate metabolism flavoprotein domain protein [Verrucomicrobia bacterium]|nr:DNA/pantothenate metabolism flavoprotein domain protein [Verrucomicrobiota bacterium]
MNCVITAGPTYEPLDQVRRLTNFSTGRLGIELTNYLVGQGHQVTLLLGELATWRGESRAQSTQRFGTAADLRARLAGLAGASVQAVFHAAAVGDFAFGQVYVRQAAGELQAVTAGKLPSAQGALLAELVPTPKILAAMRDWFARAAIVGWKYEVDADRAQAIARAQEQLRACRTDACVVNGPAYGAGYGLLRDTGGLAHLESREALLAALGELARDGRPA